ncbi:hypothetical protein T10_8093 [Trichinella papuae]|uniref:Uncharacterized protein n=1 Tax=Trichinella papuae TaxID=268474 RepID=A0A0V1MNN0_9BILA|nr:hypothetical protein T10_8093 [Trichinella papuae]
MFNLLNKKVSTADLTIPSSPSQHSIIMPSRYWFRGQPSCSTYTMLPSSDFSFYPDHLARCTKFSIYSVHHLCQNFAMTLCSSFQRPISTPFQYGANSGSSSFIRSRLAPMNISRREFTLAST